MIARILVGIGVVALVLGIASHPAIVTDLGGLTHDVLAMLK